ncbi:MAG: glutamate racemase [Patescibacteria group bacterium]|jgi:glutamate racemase
MIGIFDSGVGGLTVVKELKKQLPDCSFIYLGDNARTPYGTRSQEVIQEYACEIVEFLIKRGVTAVLVACNTASAFAGELLRQKYQLPIFEVITPAAAAAVELTKGKIGVIGTRGTISSRAYEKAIERLDREIAVKSVACPLFVPLIEEDWLSKPEMKTIARKYLYPLKRQEIDTLILGCTHYPLIKKIIADKAGRRVKLIDPAEEVVKALGRYLSDNPQEQTGRQEYFVTDSNSRFKEIAKNWLKEDIQIKKADLN